MKIETLKDLKTFLNGLNEEQLSQKAFVQRVDDTPVDIISADETTEDYFYNEDSEGIIPVSEYNSEDWGGLDLEDEFNVIVPKGYVIICNE